MSAKILIIKLGAMGDVLRTTFLLGVLGGDVYWVTKKESLPLLANCRRNLKQIFDIDNAKDILANYTFDLVLCLEDDKDSATLASRIKTKNLIGSFLKSDGSLCYTDSAAEWFDMGLISKLGKEKADTLKKENTKTYQEILFNMIGRRFNGEEYCLNPGLSTNTKSKPGNKMLIGIETRADKRWPTKCWNRYNELGNLWVRDGYAVKFFCQRDTLQKYINDINECDVVVAGDTLALHLALAFKIKVAGIFTCTSPNEIYDYKRMAKVISPLWKEAFYSRNYIPEAVEAVSLEEVYNAVKGLLVNNVCVL